jgi:glycosyltransferase involved in cell wall biosynthesis
LEETVLKVSVVITVYNLENFVAEAIQSVLSQTHPANEIIVVDDGSKDGSVKAIESFGDQVKLVKMEKNSGVLPAFLAGIKASSGDILSFLDGDDVWMPEKLEKVMKVFERDADVMMITHFHEWINKEGVATGETDATHANMKRITSIAHNEEELDHLLKNSILCYKGVWLGSAFCIRRSNLPLEAYEKWVTSLPGTGLSHQDQPLAAYMIYANPGKRIHLINEVLFRYRVYPTNSSGSSINLPSAIRTVKRSIATVSRTRDIVGRKPEWKEENYRQQMKLMELEFYRELYNKRRWKAFAYYLKLLSGYWDKPQKIKETKRLVACLLIGPTKFLRLKTKKRFS